MQSSIFHNIYHTVFLMLICENLIIIYLFNWREIQKGNVWNHMVYNLKILQDESFMTFF